MKGGWREKGKGGDRKRRVERERGGWREKRRVERKEKREGRDKYFGEFVALFQSITKYTKSKIVFTTRRIRTHLRFVPLFKRCNLSFPYTLFHPISFALSLFPCFFLEAGSIPLAFPPSTISTSERTCSICNIGSYPICHGLRAGTCHLQHTSL